LDDKSSACSTQESVYGRRLSQNIYSLLAKKTNSIIEALLFLGEAMSNSLPIARLAVHLIAGVGVSKVVNDIIVNNTKILTTADAVKVWTGSVVIGSMISEQAVKHVNGRVDALVAWNAARKAAPAA
jgi:hypothetical protein